LGGGRRKKGGEKPLRIVSLSIFSFLSLHLLFSLPPSSLFSLPISLSLSLSLSSRPLPRDKKTIEKRAHVLRSSLPSTTSCRGRFSKSSTFQGRGPRALARAIAVERPPGPPPTTMARRARRGFGEEAEVEVDASAAEARTRIDRCIIECFSTALACSLSLAFDLLGGKGSQKHRRCQTGANERDLEGGDVFPEARKRGRRAIFKRRTLWRRRLPNFCSFFRCNFSLPSLFSLPPPLFLFPSLSLPSSYKTLFLASSSFLTTSSGVLSSAFAIAALAAAGSDEKRSQRSPSTTCRDG